MMSFRQPPPSFVNREKELSAIDFAIRNNIPIIQITGPGGIGKSALAEEFALRRGVEFPAGVLRLSPQMGRIEEVIWAGLPTIGSEPGLVIADYFELFSEEAIRSLKKSCYVYPNLKQIWTGRPSQEIRLPSLELGGLFYERIVLEGLSFQHTLQIIDSYGATVDDNAVRAFFSASSGSPLLTSLFSASLKEGRRPSEFFDDLQNFSLPGIFGPDGRPVSTHQTIERALVSDVCEVNDELLKLLAENPHLLREVPSRKFEQIVAEIFRRNGYQVSLTPETRDGGFDIAAAKKDGVGSFLYLIECKRYSPPNKVGVGVVRSLNGVVEAQNANAGIVVTSSFFTKEALEFRSPISHRLQVADYLALQQWLRSIRND